MRTILVTIAVTFPEAEETNLGDAQDIAYEMVDKVREYARRSHLAELSLESIQAKED
jgi:hypothetical protein